MTENLPNETKRRSKGIILTTRTQHKHPRRTILTRQPPQPPVLLPKAAIRLHRLANEPRRGLLLFQLPSRCLLRPAPRCSRRPETRPLLHLWPSHLRPLQVRARQQASTWTTIHWHVTRSNHVDDTFIFESPLRLWCLHYACTCAFSCAREP